MEGVGLTLVGTGSDVDPILLEINEDPTMTALRNELSLARQVRIITRSRHFTTTDACCRQNVAQTAYCL